MRPAPLIFACIRFRVISICLLWQAFAAAEPPRQITHQSGRVRTESFAVKNLDVRHQYSLLYSLSSLRNLTVDTRVRVILQPSI